jgi:D-alanyl-D-alanine carboxypeptidase
VIRIDSPCGTVWGHGGDTRGHRSRAVATEDGRRTAIADATAQPSITASGDGVSRYVQVVSAADTALTCEMLDRPVPADVAGAPR